jgi:hypothetical protein
MQHGLKNLLQSIVLYKKQLEQTPLQPKRRRSGPFRAAPGGRVPETPLHFGYATTWRL